MTGQAVLVTGAGSGIGLATTQALLQAGHTVFAGARRPAHLQMLQSIGATALPLDVRDAAQVQQAADTVSATVAASGHGSQVPWLPMLATTATRAACAGCRPPIRPLPTPQLAC